MPNPFQIMRLVRCGKKTVSNLFQEWGWLGVGEIRAVPSLLFGREGWLGVVTTTERNNWN